MSNKEDWNQESSNQEQVFVNFDNHIDEEPEENLIRFLNEYDRQQYTETFEKEVDLNDLKVRYAIDICGLSIYPETYTEEERQIVLEKLRAIRNDFSITVEAIEKYFKNKKNGISEIAKNKSIELIENLDREAIEISFNLGEEHGNLMGKVIPYAAITRLKELINNGTLRENFIKIWRQSNKQLGKTLLKGGKKGNLISLPDPESSDPSELSTLIQGIIQQQMLIVIQQDKQHLKIQKEKLILQSTKRYERWKAIKQWGNLVNSWTWIVLLTGIVYSLGIHTGLNLIAKGVLCQSRESLCYFLRFDNNKKALE